MTQDFNEYQSTIQTFVKKDLGPISLQVEKQDRIPDDVVDKMRQLGLFGLSIPKEYGVLGLSTL